MKNSLLLLLSVTFGLAVFLTACKNEKAATASYFDITALDTTVAAGDNFFKYANGGWLKTAKIPDDQTGWGSFYTLYQENLIKLRTILETAAGQKNLKAGSDEQKVGDFFASGMDTMAIEKTGYEPLKGMLAKIDAAKDYKALVQLIAEGQKTGFNSLLGTYVGADEKNSAQNILSLVQSGLSLPEKEYYTRKDSISVAQRQQLVSLATQYFVLTGMDKAAAEKAGADILKIETAMSVSHLLPVELRDPIKNYNKYALADLEKLSPNLSWTTTLQSMGIKTDSINVSQPGYYAALSNLLASQPVDVWKNKLKFDYISSNASLLSKAFRDEEFNFIKLFTGAKQQQDRWKKMVQETDNGLKDPLGKLYVAKHFTPEAKKRMDELVDNLQKSFSTHIKNLDWMTAETKVKAQEKLAAIMKKIGYTDKWKSYDDVTINRDDFFGNMLNIRQHDWNEKIQKIGKAVDKTEWDMTPPTVNAYYNPTFNEIVFPAGILQFPFFDAGADDAINYGAIGMVIGHEFTHGFDDQGRQYDAVGNLTDWWTKADADQFKSKTAKVVSQYNEYTVLDGMHVNGELTLGENLADFGGLAIAYDAFKMTKQGQSEEKIDGFTPDQRFFLGYAQVWRILSRDETMRTRINTDPHSPEEFRVNGPMSNFEPFYKAFGVTETSKMYRKPEDRVTVW